MTHIMRIDEMFRPKKRNADDVDYIKNLFLNGTTIRKDGTDAFDISSAHNKRNIGEGGGQIINIDANDFTKALDELKDEGYIIKTKSGMGGCCQYSVTAYWLEGDFADE